MSNKNWKDYLTDKERKMIPPDGFPAYEVWLGLGEIELLLITIADLRKSLNEMNNNEIK